jgi:hypothetical protein
MLSALLLLATCAEAPWQRELEEDGLVVESQQVEGSAFENLRVTGTTTATPEQFMKAWWGKATDSSASPEIIRRELFVDQEDERLYWDQIHAPPASDRDYVMHLSKRREDNGAQALRFESVDDPRKPKGDLVRMKLEGALTATPTDKGARIVYVVHTDLGGAIPAFFARGAQRRSALGLVREIRRRAEAPKKNP